MADPQTDYALRLLRKLAASSHDRRACRAVDHLHRQIGRAVERCDAVNTNHGSYLKVAGGEQPSRAAQPDVDGDDEWLSNDGPIPDDTIDASIQASTAQDLIDAMRAEPLPAQARIVDGAIADAQRAGLRLPRFSIEWREGRKGVCAGAVTWKRATTGTFTMYLSVNAQPGDLRETVWHEAQHLHDFHSGVNFTRVELERRAVNFANSMGGRR